MTENRFNFSSQWLKADNLTIVSAEKLNRIFKGIHYKYHDNYICCKRVFTEEDESDNGRFLVETYNPFEYSVKPLNSDIVNSILGNTQQEFYMHTLFASLDFNNDIQVTTWCKYFGFPRYDYSINELFDELMYGYHDIHVLGSLSEIKTEIQTFKLIMRLSDLLTTPKNITPDIINSLIDKDMFELLMYDYRAYTRQLTYENFIEYVKMQDYESSIYSLVNGTINERIKGITPYIANYGDKWDYEWEFNNLLTALYFMFSLDISIKKIPKLCENPLCRHFFTPTRESAKYCSLECQNRTRQRRHRAKIKKEKEQV